MDLPGSDIGAYRSQTLTDSTIFDFYNNLLDGDTKWESQDWDTYNLNFSQSFFNNRFSYELVYNKQEYSQAQESLLSGWTESLSIDVRTTLYDGTENPNYGRVYVANRGQYGNTSSDVERENFRFTATGELRGSDFFDEDSIMAHIIGKHVFTGLYSKEKTETDSRSWKLYNISDDDWATITANGLATGNDTNLNFVVYLTDSLVDMDSYEGLYINPISSITVPTTLTVSYFDTTWIGDTLGVNFDDYWDDGSADGSTQAENPDNYVGWTTDTFDFTTSENDRDSLYTSAKLVGNTVTSKSFVWQAYLLDGLVVPTFGYREDESETWSYTASNDDNILLDDNTIDINNGYYVLPNEDDLDTIDSDNSKNHSIDSDNSKSFSLVVHSPNFINKYLPFGLQLSGFYNKSENFQPIAGRVDCLGEELVSPTGDTTDYGFVITALDNRVSLKVNWYKTIVENASMSGGLGALSSAVWALGGLEARGGYYARLYYYGESLGYDSYSWDWSHYPNEYTVYNSDGSVDDEASAAAASAAEAEALEAWFANEVSDQFQDAWNIDYGTIGSSDFSSTAPTGLAATCDQESKGIEFELYLKPTDNWSITMNASKTEARRYNLGASLEEWILYRDEVFQGAAGSIRNWWIGGTTTIRDSWNTMIMSNYQLFKQLENADSPELRPWRANLITNYYFSEGPLKGFSVGGGYRWQDKAIIGYYIADYDGDGNWSYDLDSPYYGKSTSAFDLWFAYARPLTDSVDWRIQVNIRNVFGKKELIPLNVTPTIEDPTELEVASWAIAEDMSFSVTNTFTF